MLKKNYDLLLSETCNSLQLYDPEYEFFNQHFCYYLKFKFDFTRVMLVIIEEYNLNSTEFYDIVQKYIINMNEVLVGIRIIPIHWQRKFVFDHSLSL